MSLIEVAQKLLALNPDAVELFKKANGKASLVRTRQVFCVINGGICSTCTNTIKLLIVTVKMSDVSVCISLKDLKDIRLIVTLIWSVVYLYISIWMLYLHSCFVVFLFLAMLDEDEDDRVDETALQQLTEMGFPESRAIKALRLNQ